MCKPLLHYFAPTWIVCRFPAIHGWPFVIKYVPVPILEIFDWIYHVHLGPSAIAFEFYYYEAPVSFLLYVMRNYQLWWTFFYCRCIEREHVGVGMLHHFRKGWARNDLYFVASIWLSLLNKLDESFYGLRKQVEIFCIAFDLFGDGMVDKLLQVFMIYAKFSKLSLVLFDEIVDLDLTNNTCSEVAHSTHRLRLNFFSAWTLLRDNFLGRASFLHQVLKFFRLKHALYLFLAAIVVDVIWKWRPVRTQPDTWRLIQWLDRTEVSKLFIGHVLAHVCFNNSTKVDTLKFVPWLLLWNLARFEEH